MWDATHHIVGELFGFIHQDVHPRLQQPRCKGFLQLGKEMKMNNINSDLSKPPLATARLHGPTKREFSCHLKSLIRKIKILILTIVPGLCLFDYLYKQQAQWRLKP